MEYVVLVICIVIFIGSGLLICLLGKKKKNKGCGKNSDDEDAKIANLLVNENSGIRANVYFEDFRKKDDYPHYLGKKIKYE